MEEYQIQVELVDRILKLLTGAKFPLTNEKVLQRAIEIRFKNNFLGHHREYELDQHNIVDFFINGVAMEVKIKAGAKEIYRQCERYCQFDEVKSLLLVTNRAMGFPKQINGRPCYVLNLGKAWL
ncbi:MAG: hypothetical protein PHT07_15485 [Paludibacter sp.]|nr:hypothetical protein [Paludibacter sp.]